MTDTGLIDWMEKNKVSVWTSNATTFYNTGMEWECSVEMGNVYDGHTIREAVANAIIGEAKDAEKSSG